MVEAVLNSKGDVMWISQNRIIGKLVNAQLEVLDKDLFQAERLCAVYDDSDNQAQYKAWFPDNSPDLTKSYIRSILNYTLEEDKKKYEEERKEVRRLIRLFQKEA